VKLPELTQLQTHATEVNRVFAHHRMEDIIAELEQLETPFLRETLEKLRAKSPTSLKLTLRLLRLGRATPTLAECLAREYAACHGILASGDFYEGVRAAVIDKDRNPKWSPAGLAAVPDSDIETYFQPAPNGLWGAA
jgi:enoyl-CoA hydratase